MEAFLEYAVHRILVGDVSSHKLVAWILGDIRKALRIAGVRQTIEIYDFDVTTAIDQMAYKIRPNKSCPARN
jgi:hypothetical protein